MWNLKRISPINPLGESGVKNHARNVVISKGRTAITALVTRFFRSVFATDSALVRIRIEAILSIGRVRL